jgi:hypothetical protein
VCVYHLVSKGSWPLARGDLRGVLNDIRHINDLPAIAAFLERLDEPGCIRPSGAPCIVVPFHGSIVGLACHVGCAMTCKSLHTHRDGQIDFPAHSWPIFGQRRFVGPFGRARVYSSVIVHATTCQCLIRPISHFPHCFPCSCPLSRPLHSWP